ncbi:DMT family transporter [Actinosynnema sp. NPDC050436]|uniref:DMT family transporter n=1 Tax=Actinosynnema sp. NPDC050436 TaxID=3155659 RepID=UPI0033D42B2D
MLGDVRVLGALFAFVGEVFLAVQGRINGQLGSALGDGFLAALVSFGGGVAVLLVAVPATRAGRAGLVRLRGALRGGGLRWWQCAGGACGAFFVSAQGLTVPVLGVATFTVAVVAAQVVGSLLVDRAGIGPAGVRPFTWPRVAGAGLAVVAVGVAVSDELGRPAALWPALLPALAGFGLGWQQAVNGLVWEAARSTRVTTLVNFATGSVVLAVVCAVDVTVRGLPAAAPGEPWLYAGGVLGIVAIGTAVVAVRYSGVLLVGLGQVAGQLVGAVAVDAVVPAAGGLSPVTVVGTALTLVAVGVAALPARRRGRPARRMGGWRA